MKHIFLTIPAGAEPGLTSVSLGLLHSLDRNGINAGFYKPFSQSHDPIEVDRSRLYLEAVTDLCPPPSMSKDIFEAKVQEGQIDDLLSEVLENVDQLLTKHDVVVVEGLLPTADLSVADELNIGIARSLNAEVVIVKQQQNESLEEVKKSLDQFVSNLPAAYKTTQPAVILNRVAEYQGKKIDLGNFQEALSTYRTAFGNSGYDTLGLIPETPELGHMRMTDLVKVLDAKVIHDGNMDERRVSSIRICARQVENMLDSLVPGALIVTPADRSDIIVACALAAQKGVRLAGIILTGDVAPSPQVINYCNEAFELASGLPVLEVQDSSFEIATRLYNLNTEVPVEDHERIRLVMTTSARFIDSQWLRDRLEVDFMKRLSPVAFKHQLSRHARQANKRILLPEGEEERTITAAIDCASRQIARCVLIGDPKKILSKIKALGLDLPANLELLDPVAVRDQYIEPLFELRKHKGMTLEAAKDALADNILLATIMVANGDADGLVSGAQHSTAHTIRPALQLIKPAPGNKVVSSIFFMCLPDQVYIYGDCAVNPDPNAEQLAEIAIQSAYSAKAFGIEPKVAMISYSTLGSGSGSDVEKVTEATAIIKERAPELLVDGPLQYDAATTASVAAKKAPDSPVAGQANVLVFPDLNTGNTTYKAVQRSANVASIGPMLQGLNKPVNDLSRGTTVEDIVYTIALTSIQAKARDEQ